MKRALIISPHFPPSTLAGVHRARHLVKHLPAHGWKAKVICVDPRFHVERLDPDLAKLVPAAASIVQVGALPVGLTRPFGISGDIGLRGLIHIRGAIEREMHTAPPDVVMITGSPYFPMLLAGWIKRRFHVPVILDFQDPWVTPVGAGARIGSKAWLSHQLALRLEPHAVRHATFITSVSDRQNETLAARWRFIDQTRMASIPIGGDPEDFCGLRATASEDPAQGNSKLVFAYVGTALPRSYSLFQALFRGVALALRVKPALESKLEIRCIGTSNQPQGETTLRVTPIARAEGLDQQIIEIPARVNFLEALAILSSAHAVLMIGSDEPHYTASKIYPGMMSGRPFLSLFHKASSSHEILSTAGGGLALAFDDQEQLDSLPLKVAEALVTLATNPQILGSVDPRAYADYTAHAVAGKFAVIFDRLHQERTKVCPP